VAKVKTIQTRQWHPEGKYWSFQRSATVYREIASALAGQELEIDPALRGLIPETEADSQSYQAASASSTTPMAPLFDRIRQLIRLKHYSPRTEDTYLHWITKYLHFHSSADPNQLGAPSLVGFFARTAIHLLIGKHNP
jgi:hypothetical protein